MSWWVGELVSWWVGKLMSWWVGKLVSLWVDKLVSLWVCEPTCDALLRADMLLTRQIYGIKLYRKSVCTLIYTSSAYILLQNIKNDVAFRPLHSHTTHLIHRSPRCTFATIQAHKNHFSPYILGNYGNNK